MNITITIPDSAIAAEQARVDLFNSGSGQPPLTLQQFAQMERDELTAQRVAAYEAKLLDLMRPVGAEIAAAANGDQAKIIAALEAGKTAALATLNP